MKTAAEQPSIYIVASQTGTILSRIIKRVTRARFNHVSISLDERMDTMYSFGRRHPYNPVWGGYVKECPSSGTFARFPKTQAQIIKLNVTGEQYDNIRAHLEEMYRDRNAYHYNYAGLFLGAFDIHFQRKNHYYCSEFVRDVLVRFQIVPGERFSPIVHPQELTKDIPGGELIYDGVLAGYPRLTPANGKPGFFRQLFAA